MFFFLFLFHSFIHTFFLCSFIDELVVMLLFLVFLPWQCSLTYFKKPPSTAKDYDRPAGQWPFRNTYVYFVRHHKNAPDPKLCFCLKPTREPLWPSSRKQVLNLCYIISIATTKDKKISRSVYFLIRVLYGSADVTTFFK